MQPSILWQTSFNIFSTRAENDNDEEKFSKDFPHFSFQTTINGKDILFLLCVCWSVCVCMHSSRILSMTKCIHFSVNLCISSAEIKGSTFLMSENLKKASEFFSRITLSDVINQMLRILPLQTARHLIVSHYKALIKSATDIPIPAAQQNRLNYNCNYHKMFLNCRFPQSPFLKRLRINGLLNNHPDVEW